MNGKTHKAIGASAGAAFGLARVICDAEFYDLEDRAQVVVAATAGGLIGGMVPDFLEPATSPNHRGAFHSFFVLFILVLIGFLMWNRKNKAHLGQAFCEGIVVGCGSHLVADSFTPKGLPAIG